MKILLEFIIVLVIFNLINMYLIKLNYEWLGVTSKNEKIFKFVVSFMISLVYIFIVHSKLKLVISIPLAFIMLLIFMYILWFILRSKTNEEKKSKSKSPKNKRKR